MNQRAELYSHQNLPPEELRRLNRLTYPDIVSGKIITALGRQNGTMLDAGAGPNPVFGSMVEQAGLTYFPLDLRRNYLHSRERGTQGSVLNLPFENRVFTVTHERFVLMNIAPENHLPAAMELIRVSSSATAFLEYYWGTLASSSNPAFINQFRTIAFGVFSKLHTDPLMGEKIQGVITEATKSEENLTVAALSFSRPEGTYSSELGDIITVMSAISEHLLGDCETAKNLQELHTQFQKEPFPFVPPAIIAVVVKKY